MRSLTLGGVAALAPPWLGFGRCTLAAAEPVVVSTRAVDVVLGSTVVDMLGLLTLDWPRLARWMAHPDELGERDYGLLESSGVSVFHPAVETGARDAHAGAVRWLAGWNRLLEGDACRLARIASVTELLQVPTTGRVGVLIGFQNADHFRDARDVESFFLAGQRVSQLTYNARNRLGSGCYVADDAGLSAFGAEIVREMNRLGMAIDLSHCGERTTLDAVAASRRPTLVTHTNCRALVPAQPRCKSDRVLRAVAAGGGVVGMTVVRAFVGSGQPTLEDLLDHFDHVVRVAGVEHVGLGSDVDVTARDPASGTIRSAYRIRGLQPEARVFQIADGLLRRGYLRRDVELVLGGNFVRALAAIWPTSSWRLVSERETRRDPFCPAPRRRTPPGLAADAVRGGSE